VPSLEVGKQALAEKRAPVQAALLAARAQARYQTLRKESDGRRNDRFRRVTASDELEEAKWRRCAST
jgi:hypothetical protein